MLWLQHHKVTILVGIGLILAIPAIIKDAHLSIDCLAEMRSASWTDRLEVLAHARRCPSHRR